MATQTKKKRPKAGTMVNPPVWAGTHDCTTAEICDYLTQLGVWFEWFHADYTKLRRAVCNVEKKAWSESGSTLAKRFCATGATEVPPAPAKPPVWT